mgnify:CR=1 FL=1
MTAPVSIDLKQPLPASSWLPIADAPKDGTWVWAWDANACHPYIAHFTDYDFTDQPYPIKPAQKYTGWLDEYSNAVQPTVWMHIPLSPFVAA